MARRHIIEIERSRAALSLRGIEREYGYSRAFVGERVRAGEILATPRGRALVILRETWESWMRAHALRPTAHAEARVAALLARESRRGAA